MRGEPYPVGEERSFRLMFTLMYVGLISAVVYFYLVSACSTLTLFGDTSLLIVMLLALLGIERFEQQRRAPPLSWPVRFSLLLARVILVEAVLVLDCSSIALLLYPVIPFAAYFSFGPHAGTFLTLFYLVQNFARLWARDPGWHQNQATLTIMLVFVLLLGFMQIMARVIDEDERRRRRTERLLADLEASHLQLQAYAAQVATLRETDSDFSLRAALTDLVRGVENGRFHVHLQVEGDETGYAPSVLMSLYRAAQEGLTNVQKHARATEVSLALYFGPEQARLLLEDNGRGFDTTNVDNLATSDHSFGLQGIRERVELVRGELRLASGPDAGTELEIVVPKGGIQ